MADWKLRLEARMLEIASGDDLKMERMREILSWFVEKRDMQAAAATAFRRLTEAEDLRLSPTGAPVGSLKMLLWAMEEAESNNPKQAMKWRSFRSRRRSPAGTSEMVVGVVMAPSAPGSLKIPLVVASDKELGIGEESEVKPVVDPAMVALPKMRKKMGKGFAGFLRRSPRFPRCSPRLLGLSRSTTLE